MKRSALNVAEYGLLTVLLSRLAGAQDSEGTRIDTDTWCWVTCFADFDYEYAWLIDVRTSDGTETTSDYLAVFKGYDGHGLSVYRASWWGHAATFPEVPDLYDAMAWWAQWVKDTRSGEHDITG